MDIATILFTYNRSRHTKAVLDALAQNNRLPQKLFIFQDGMKESTDRNEWEKVRNEITAVSWCDTEVIIHEKNKGLASSIKFGVSKVFQAYDAVIVLEDDCVPHPQFMEYMVKALEKYEKYKNVFHIGACSEPVDVDGDGTDAYFLGRINSWGWGTWRDRWKQFDNDYTMIGKIKSDVELNEWFTLWGQDLESHVHCGIRESGLKVRPKEKLTEIILPDQVELIRDYKRIFANYHTWTSPEVRNEYYKNVALDLLELQKNKKTIGKYLSDFDIHNIMIWGTGRLCDYLISELNHEITIDAIVETYPKKGDYKGMKVISWKEIQSNKSLIILIPGYDIKRIENMIRSAGLKNNIIPIDRLISRILTL